MATARRNRTERTSATASELATVKAALSKKFGERTLVNGSSIKQPYRIPTGAFELDRALLGGIPFGRVSMVHGKKHSGKSYISDRIIMGAQQTIEDGQVVKVDVEGTHESVWSSKIGVDVDNLLVAQPDSGEQACDMVVALTHTREVSLIVIDSLAALVPIKEQEADAEQSLVALQSRLISRMLRQISTAQITERKRGHHVTVLLVNQQRTQIGGWSPTGDPISLPGGKALGYFTSVEWQMKNKENKNKDGDLTINDHAFTIEKNKLNAGRRTGEFRLIRDESATEYGLSEGEIDDAEVMLSYAKNLGWFTTAGRAGATLTFEGQPQMHAQTTDGLIAKLYEDREYLWALRTALIAAEAQRQSMPPEFVNYILTGELYD